MSKSMHIGLHAGTHVGPAVDQSVGQPRRVSVDIRKAANESPVCLPLRAGATLGRRAAVRLCGASFAASALGVGPIGARAMGSASAAPSSQAGGRGDIRIGQSAVLSGPSASLGQEMREGIEACFKQVNDRGGVGGRGFSLITLDDGYEPDRCAANTARLITGERVFAQIGRAHV